MKANPGLFGLPTKLSTPSSRAQIPPSGKGKKDYMRLSYLISTAINKVSTWDVWLEVRHGQSSGYVHVSQDPELYPGIWTFAIMPSFVDYTRPDKGL